MKFYPEGVTPECFNRGSSSGSAWIPAKNDVLRRIRLQSKICEESKPAEIQTPISMRASVCSTSFAAFFTVSWIVSLLSSSPRG